MDSQKPNNGGDYEYVYRDTMEFIDIIVEEYDFYDDIINLIRSGDTEISIKKKKLTRTIDETWIRAIEDSLVALDTAIRKPSVYIEENEMVLPIELSRSINARSIQHLSQHTDYINKIDGDTIIPSKILNVFHDETNKTYENKFVNTLIERLYLFISKRYEKLFGDDIYNSSTQMEFKTKLVSAESEAKINFSIELFDKSDKDKNANGKENKEAEEKAKKLVDETDTLNRQTNDIKGKIAHLNSEIEDIKTLKIEYDDDKVTSESNKNTAEKSSETIAERKEISKPSLKERVDHIYGIVQGYLNSDFVKSMDKKFVRPPIIRTNAITKNKNLRQCLELWDFIESYEGIGYQIEIEETAENPNDKYISELYSLLALQYVMFKYNINSNLDEEPLAENSTDEPLMPKILTDFDDYDVDEYNVYDVDYKKLYKTDFARKLTAEQIKVRNAIDVALIVDREIKKQRILEHLAEEHAKQEKMLLEEQQRLAELEEEKQKQIQIQLSKKKVARKVKKRLKKQAEKIKLEETYEE